MEICLNMGGMSSFIAIPAEVVDKHLDVSGIYLKVLLLILRTNASNTAAIAKRLSIPENDVEEAVRYWIQCGIFAEGSAASAKAAPKENRPPRARPEVVVSAQSLTPTEIQERLGQNADIRFLFTTAEAIFGTLLTSTQQRGLIYMHETLGLPVDVIVMALEFCVSVGKGNFAYIQKLCAGWADQEINTHARAEEYIKEQTARRGRERKVQELFGIQERALTTENLRYVNAWFDKLGYDLDMIGLAYERTVNAINKLSFPYLNSILNSWYEKGIRTPQEVAIKDSRPAGGAAATGAKGARKPASYDLEEFERRGFEVPKID